jgi:N-acylneuraminate cytidylyltransferase
MRQEVEDIYVENGAFYITKRQSLLDSKLRYSGKIGIAEMPFSRSFQIDTEDDLSLMKRLI